MAMYTATGGELSVLHRSFPRCFSRRRKNLCVPVSFVREKTEAWSVGMGYGRKEQLRDRESFWEEALSELDVPLAFSWRWQDLKCESQEFEGTDLVPDEVWAQLEGKPTNCGHVVTFRSEQFVVVGILWDYYQTFNRDEEGTFTVVHANFIDLNS